MVGWWSGSRGNCELLLSGHSGSGGWDPRGETGLHGGREAPLRQGVLSSSQASGSFELGSQEPGSGWALWLGSQGTGRGARWQPGGLSASLPALGDSSGPGSLLLLPERAAGSWQETEIAVGGGPWL